MKSEFKCLVCRGEFFRPGYFETEYEKYCEYEHYNSKRDAEVGLRIKPEEEDYYIYNYIEPSVYACEDCGFIMTFMKEKKVVSKAEDKKNKQKAKMYDWSNFKK